MRDGEKTERGRRQNKITKGRYNEEGTQSQSTKGGKKPPFSGTCAISNTSMGRKDEREERKGLGKMGWLFCFKLRFNISIEKNHLLREG